MPSKQHPSLFPNVQAFGLQAHVFFEQCLDFLRMLVQGCHRGCWWQSRSYPLPLRWISSSACCGLPFEMRITSPVLHLVVNQVVGELLLPYPFFFLLLLLLFPLWALQEPFPLQDPFRSSRSLPAPAFLPRTFLLPFPSPVSPVRV